MTSSGKIRIYELSRDLNLDNKDVLDAAKKLSIPVKSHSSSISDLDADKIKNSLSASGKKKIGSAPQNKQASGKEILSLKKAVGSPSKPPKPNKEKSNPENKASTLKNKPSSPKPEITKLPTPPSPIKAENLQTKQPQSFQIILLNQALLTSALTRGTTSVNNFSRLVCI